MRFAYFFLSVVFVLQLSGCASMGGETLKIDARNVPGVQHVPDELTVMLRELGYDWIHVQDPNSHRGVKTVQRDGEFHMRFEYVETRQARIDVRVRIQDGFTWLRFYEPGSQSFSSSSQNLFEALKRRVAQEFGAANVSH